ncbi:hypothetical protein X975_03508, partial [Stegodyphus mimosarum]
MAVQPHKNANNLKKKKKKKKDAAQSEHQLLVFSYISSSQIFLGFLSPCEPHYKFFQPTA